MEHPIITQNKKVAQFIYWLNLKNDEFLELELQTFIRRVHHHFQTNFAIRKESTEVIMSINENYLASLVVDAYNNSENKEENQESIEDSTATARFCITFTIDETDPYPLTIKEEVQYSVHSFANEKRKDQVVLLFPIGFQMLHSLNKTNNDRGIIVSSLIFDLRVFHHEIEQSMAFYKEEIIPKLNRHLNYLRDQYVAVTSRPVSIDYTRIEHDFMTSLVSHYEHRLANPDDPTRAILYISTLFEGTEPEHASMRLYITASTEKTLTPQYSIVHPDHKRETIKQNEILHSYVLDTPDR